MPAEWQAWPAGPHGGRTGGCLPPDGPQGGPSPREYLDKDEGAGCGFVPVRAARDAMRGRGVGA